MSGVPLAYGGYRRTVGGMPEIVQTNVFAEKAPSKPTSGFVLIGRAGLEDFATQPNGGRRGIYQAADIFGSDALLVCGATAARLSAAGALTTFSGTIGGSGRVRIATGRNDAGDDIARVATGDGLFLLSGSSAVAEDFPEPAGAGAQDIENLRDFWFALEAGTDKFFVKIPGDAATWDPIQFAGSTYQHDRGVGVRALGDQIWIGNSTSTEVFGLTGDADIVAPQQGLAWNFGWAARDAAVSNGDMLVFVDSDFSVRATQGGYPDVISDEGLSEELRRSDPASLVAWMMKQDQHWLYILSSNRRTWAIDLQTRLQHPWTSQGYDFWRADMGCGVGGGRYVALDSRGPDIWRLNTDRYFDVDEEIDCSFTAIAALDEGELSCDNFVIDCATGLAPVSGAGSDPKIALRYSDTDGRTWSDWRERSLGLRGHFADMIKWNGLGRIKAPGGRLFQVRSTDGTVRRFSNPRINVA